MENHVEGPQTSKSRVAIRSRKRISFPGGSDGKESACHAGDTLQSLGLEDPVAVELVFPSSLLVSLH